MQNDLTTLAKGCLCDNPNKLSLDDELEKDLKTIVKFCDAYYQVMQDKRSVLNACTPSNLIISFAVLKIFMV